MCTQQLDPQKQSNLSQFGHREGLTEAPRDERTSAGWYGYGSSLVPLRGRDIRHHTWQPRVAASISAFPSKGGGVCVCIAHVYTCIWDGTSSGAGTRHRVIAW